MPRRSRILSGEANLNADVKMHPVEIIQKNVRLVRRLILQNMMQEEEMKLKGYAIQWGSQVPFQIALERTRLGAFNRPGMTNSHIHLELHMGRLGRIDAQDVFGGNTHRPLQLQTRRTALMKRPRVSTDNFLLANEIKFMFTN